MAIPAILAAARVAVTAAGRQLIKNAPKIYKVAKKKYKKSVGKEGLLFKGGAIDTGIKRGAKSAYVKLSKIQKAGTTITRKKGDKIYYTKAGKKTTHGPTIKKYKKTKFVKGKTGGYKHDIVKTKTQTGVSKAAEYTKSAARVTFDHSNKVKLVGMSGLYGGISGRISSRSQKRKNKQRRKGM
tara:strand:+ start:115 stop:663 length:549 start_codon:yes stop_codon:yes gene_type:complete